MSDRIWKSHWCLRTCYVNAVDFFRSWWWNRVIVQVFHLSIRSFVPWATYKARHVLDRIMCVLLHFHHDLVIQRHTECSLGDIHLQMVPSIQLHSGFRINFTFFEYEKQTSVGYNEDHRIARLPPCLDTMKYVGPYSLDRLDENSHLQMHIITDDHMSDRIWKSHWCLGSRYVNAVDCWRHLNIDRVDMEIVLISISEIRQHPECELARTKSAGVHTFHWSRAKIRIAAVFRNESECHGVLVFIIHNLNGHRPTVSVVMSFTAKLPPFAPVTVSQGMANSNSCVAGILLAVGKDIGHTSGCQWAAAWRIDNHSAIISATHLTVEISWEWNVLIPVTESHEHIRFTVHSLSIDGKRDWAETRRQSKGTAQIDLDGPVLNFIAFISA